MTAPNDPEKSEPIDDPQGDKVESTDSAIDSAAHSTPIEDESRQDAGVRGASMPDSKNDSKEKAKKKKSPWYIKVAQLVLFVIFAPIIVSLIWHSSPRLQSAVGSIFYETQTPYLEVSQGNESISSARSLMIRISGQGANEYTIKLYKNERASFPSAIELEDYRDSVMPSPVLSMESLSKNAVSARPLWEKKESLQFLNSSHFESRVDLPKGLDAGEYLYTVSVNAHPASKMAAGAFRVSDISFIRKIAPNRVLVRAFDVNTLKPVSGATVSLFLPNTGSRAGAYQAEKTGNDGIALFRRRAPHMIGLKDEIPKSETSEQLNLSDAENLANEQFDHTDPDILVQLGKQKASISESYQDLSQWHSRTENYSNNYPTGATPRVTDIICDKPIYRLGQEVFFKGFTRQLRANGGYAPPLSAEQAAIQIYDPEGNKVKEQRMQTGKIGDFGNSYKIPDEGKTGTYRINVQLGDSHESTSQAFTVLQYRKPEYEVSITPEKPYVIAGEKVKAKLSAKYFFGGPVAGATVKYTIQNASDINVLDNVFEPSAAGKFFNISRAERYERGIIANNTYENPQITGSGTTNPEGELEISIDTKALSKNNPFESGNQPIRYTVNATLTDLSRKSVDSEGSAIATPGDFALAIDSDSAIAKPGENFLTKVKANKYNGVSAGVQDVELSIESWAYEKEKWTKKAVIASTKIKTKSTGEGVGELKLPDNFNNLQDGRVFLCARSKDEAGREISDYTYIWIAGAYASSDLKLELDKLVYEQTDKVRATLTLPEKLARKKLFGIASIDGTTIFAHQSLNQDTLKNAIEFQLKENYAPTARLAVIFVDEDLNTYSQEAILRIYPRSSILNVAFKPLKEKLEPGQFAEFLLDAKSADGKPATNSSLVLSVVDESIFAISPDTHPDVTHVYQGSRPLWVSQSTACRPVLDLPREELPLFVNPLTVLFQESFSNVTSQMNRLNAMEGGASDAMKTRGFAPQRQAIELSESIAGDAAPKEAAAASPAKETAIRTDFKDTAYFNGSILTDAKGQARIRIKLPDNLTTWRASASLLSPKTQTAFSKSSVISTKPVLARLSLPRFFTQDDVGVITAIIHNFTDKQQKIDVELQVKSQFKLASAPRQTITVAAHGAERITWPVEVVGDGKTKITLIAKAVGAGAQNLSDALAQDITVLSHSFPAFATKNGILKNEKENIDLPLKLFPDARPGSGRFTLSVSSSAIGPVLGNFDKLIDYPYGCTEQTMSKMMPSVVALQLHKNLYLPLSADMEKLFKRVYHKSMAKLVEHHNDDGGWGWWQGDQSNLYLTSYVMEGLHLLKSAGYGVDQSMIDSGKAWLKSQLNEFRILPPKLDERIDLAYAFYVLSLYGEEPGNAFLETAKGAQAAWGPEALSYLTLGLSNSGDQESAKKTYVQLMTTANQSWNFVSWEHTPELLKRVDAENSRDYSYRFTPAESTALGFRAVLRMDPGNDKLTSSIRQWILLQHDENGWANTKTTSQVFLALLADELKEGRNHPSDFKAEAVVKGKTMASYLFNKANRYSTEKILKFSLVGTENALFLKKQGQGKLYYNSILEYERRIQKGKNVVPRSSPPDLAIEREFYKLERIQIPKTNRFRVQGIPIGESKIKTGDIILMKVRINAPFEIPYVKVEAPLPSGAEVLSDQANIDTRSADSDSSDATDDDFGYFNYWWTHQDILDDRIVFFVTSMNSGKAEFQALLRMELPGELNANPVRFEGMYTKAVRGYSNAAELKVVEASMVGN